jgi:hypothetical protein
LVFGTVGRFGGSSGGFVVAALNAASAASREVVVLRVLSEGIIYVLAQGFPFLNANWAAKAAVPALTINRLCLPSRQVGRRQNYAVPTGQTPATPECL